MVEANTCIMKQKVFIIPFEVMEELKIKGAHFSVPLLLAFCDYFFKGKKPQHLTNEQSEFFKQNVKHKIKITWI